MTLGLIFWICMLLWIIIFGVNTFQPQPWSGWGSGILGFILFLTLGWATFGAPVR